MGHNKAERIEIGRRIYEGEITKYMAADEYGISEMTARDYMRLYRDVNRLPPKHRGESEAAIKEKNEIDPKQVMEEINEERRQLGYDVDKTSGLYFMKRDECKVIEKLSKKYTLTLLCDLIGMPKGTYYYWKRRNAKLEQAEAERQAAHNQKNGCENGDEQEESQEAQDNHETMTEQ